MIKIRKKYYVISCFVILTLFYTPGVAGSISFSFHEDVTENAVFHWKVEKLEVLGYPEETDSFDLFNNYLSLSENDEISITIINNPVELDGWYLGSVEYWYDIILNSEIVGNNTLHFDFLRVASYYMVDFVDEYGLLLPLEWTNNTGYTYEVFVEGYNDLEQEEYYSAFDYGNPDEFLAINYFNVSKTENFLTLTYYYYELESFGEDSGKEEFEFHIEIIYNIQHGLVHEFYHKEIIYDMYSSDISGKVEFKLVNTDHLEETPTTETTFYHSLLLTGLITLSVIVTLKKKHRKNSIK
ncbi:MAG: hypothetical protein GOP50_02635 [Candidatus Heimdallarchaeota archaeon]|nr:hypothetical protein [Candidatus Heimdallarchaeota archaeon]